MPSPKKIALSSRIAGVTLLFLVGLGAGSSWFLSRAMWNDEADTSSAKPTDIQAADGQPKDAQKEMTAGEGYTKTSFKIDVGDWNNRRSAGGIIAGDVNGDNQLDFVITQPDRILAYDQAGSQLWRLANPNIQLSGQSEKEGLPGLHGPGIQVGDVDGDGSAELLYVDRDNRLHALDAATGSVKHQIRLPKVDSRFDRWEHAIIANFRGEGDVDLLLQASERVDNRRDYYRDTHIAAFRFTDLVEQGTSASPLWSRTDFIAPSHGPGLVTDITGDGRDEVLGAMVLNSDGEVLMDLDIGNRDKPHVDSLAVDDIRPDRPGLELVIPIEDSDRAVYLFDAEQVLFKSTLKADSTDGDKVQIGNFDPSRPGLEIWFRGKDADDMWVLDAEGNQIADYDFDSRSPEGWTDSGIDSIHRIRWSGGDKEYIAAKERHEDGDAGIFDAMTGQAILQVDENTNRIYVADVAGDWREELIVISGNQLSVYENSAVNPNPDAPALWEQPQYRRRKMTWNYYSP